MKKYLAIVLLGLSNLVTAQTVQTTPNQITSGTTHTWSGATTGSLPSSYMPGGPQPLYDPSTNTISFSYGQATVAQTFAINQALQSVGAGVTVQGYNYSWDIRNMNGDNRQPATDTLTATVKTYAANNTTIIRTDSWTYNSKIDWTNFAGIVNYASPASVSTYGNLRVEFSGKDVGFWAGYFGPQVRNVSIGLRYTADPCYSNPAYSPTCANYNTVSISESLLSGITGPQAYAINTALAAAGSGATIHGFNYGYDYNVAGRSCAIWNLFGICLSGWNYSDAGVNTSITNSGGTTIYSESNTHNGGDNGTSGTYSKQYRLSSSVPMSTLGTFSMSPWTSGDASITNMYSRAVYTADPCLTNPLSSTTCSGYAAAYLTQQCTANALYDSSCPGYAQAVFSQQCTANQLSNPACPGYAAAYLTQQCNINSLYSTTCSGYTSAMNQCTTNPLSNSMCPSYSTATTECNANPLYGTYCSGYTAANLSCSTNALNASYCPGYQTALSTCSTNPLSNTMCSSYTTAVSSCATNALTASYCPDYQTTLNACSANPLTNTMCPSYGTAMSSCTTNALTASYCPGYQSALSTCSINPLSNTLCSSYQTATTSCSANVLNASYCPGYQSALSTCSVNPLSNTMCSGYQTASQSCITNPLYASYCSGYQSALTTCSINPLSNTMCSGYQTATSSCSVNPLSASYCPGYQTATASCSSNVLNASYCPGYQSALNTCTTNPLSNTMCSGYQFAYSCSLDGLYSRDCPNYSEAYAKKNILNVGTTTTVTTTTSTSTIVLAQTSDPVAQAAPIVADPVVNNIVTTKSTATTSETSPAAAVKLTAPATTTTTITQETTTKDTKKTDTATVEAPKDGVRPERPTTTREQLAEQRREAARKEAVQKGKDLANEMGRMADMQAQMDVQNVVIQAMGFTPGFDNYSRFMLPDGQAYRPFTIYNNQRVVDTPAGRGLFGATDRLHSEMVDSQYNLGN
jgi:hypothetical protein